MMPAAMAQGRPHPDLLPEGEGCLGRWGLPGGAGTGARWLLAAMAIITSLLATPVAAAERSFPETGNAVSGAFLDFFEANGGVDIFGYPRSGEIDLAGRRVQYFQRARFEWWPENPAAFQVQLGLLGDEVGGARSPATLTPDPNRRLFAETGHSIAGAFRIFWEMRGGLTVFGYPIGPEMEERGRTVQYFQRARFEWHPANPPAYQVQLGLLGDEQISAGRITIPATRSAATNAAGSPGWLVVSTDIGGPFFLMRPNGTETRRLGNGIDPSLSPDGARVTYTVEDGPAPGLYAMNVTDGSTTRLIEGRGLRGPLFSPNGQEIAFYQRSDCLRRLSSSRYVDDSCFQVRVAPVAGGSDWLPPGQDLYSHAPTWSPNGQRLIFRDEKGLATASRSESARSIGPFDPLVQTPIWSPRGGKVAVARNQNWTWYEVGVVNDDGARYTQLTRSPAFADRPWSSQSPAWSPDGQQIAFVSDRDGAHRVWVMRADGSDAHRVSDLVVNPRGARERLIHWGGG
ncbi:MAG: hypothetical protein EPO26_06615 [Chloroflexota bacterium]|nr:MAG: hypothetical protein EPO26_06615 [Chloroflexota bacterium]